METQNISRPSRGPAGPKTSPKDFFINLGVIALLYFLVGNTIALLFDAIDAQFPRTLAESVNMYAPDISFPLAALIIGFPFFVYLSRMLLKEEESDVLKRELFARKWLTYLTLFIAGVAMAVDLIILLSTFLRGDEIVTGFVLKVITIFVVAGAVFGYYISDQRYKGVLPIKTYFAYGSTAFVILVISFGFFVFGSPATQKAKRFDSERVANLQSVQYQVLDYWQNKKTVPEKLDDLKDPMRNIVPLVDPRTGASYGYEKISTVSFKLCATFEREGGIGKTYGGVPASSSVGRVATPVIVGLESADYWGHGIGEVCFDRTIDPARYQLKM